MTSDYQIKTNVLKKIECSKCGLVRSGISKQKSKLANVYNKNYSYNTGKTGDVVFFTKTGNKNRSSQAFEWNQSLLSKNNLSKINTIVEIGCGEGNLLSQLKKKYPQKKIIGFEANPNAIKIAQQKGLDVRKFTEKIQAKADLIIAYAVIEHSGSPTKFLHTIVKMLNPKGFVIIGTPHQNSIYYDVFFEDHLFHFTINHLRDIGLKCNLKLIKSIYGRKPIPNFAVLLFQQNKSSKLAKTSYRTTQVRKSIKFYNSIFKKINLFLKKIKNDDKLAVFGLGETFNLFFAYTKLRNKKIHYGIDDFIKNKNNYSFPIISTNRIPYNKIEHILVCINPSYYNFISKKIESKKSNVFFPFKN